MKYIIVVNIIGALYRGSCVDVIRFCHHLIVKGKCHHEGDGDIEQGRAEEIDGVKSGGGREDDR